MLPLEEAHLIAALHRRGLSFREISRIAGHARQTVAKYLRAPATVPPRDRVAGHDSLEAFQAYLTEHLAVPEWSIKCLLSGLRGLGYEGSRNALKQYVRPYRATRRESEFAWMLAVLQGAVSQTVLAQQLNDPPGLEALLAALDTGRRAERNRALTVLAQRRGIGRASVCAFLHINRTTFRKYCCKYRTAGVEVLMAPQVRGVRKANQDVMRHAVFALLHTPPSSQDLLEDPEFLSMSE